jgi:LCP family protein required for cell wall assembly
MLPESRSVDLKASGTAVNRKRPLRALRIVIVVLAVILAILASFYVMLKVAIRPPDIDDAPKPSEAGEPGVSVAPAEQPVRDKTKYTLAILGMDNGFGNTDTMMVATFDDAKYTLNVVSIPRDTLVNVSWPIKKANSFYAYGKTDGVIEGLADLLGYHVDNYVKINLDAFSKLVDAIGGVYFDVPRAMNYEDPAQDLFIHLSAGPQLLDGPHALQLVRARQNVWAKGDIGRIEMQQAFLKEAAGQILEKKNSIKVKTLIDIILNDVDTNLTKGNLGWYAKEFLKMDAANVSFETLPANYYDSVNGDSYCTIDVPEWLEVINTKLNPSNRDVKAENLSILTRGADGKLYVTDGNWAGKKSWGSGSSSSSPGVDSTPSPSALNPSPGTDPSPTSSEDISPSPSITPTEPSPSPTDTSPNASPSGSAGDASTSPVGIPEVTPSAIDSTGVG